jgi:hypothetical protein
VACFYQSDTDQNPEKEEAHFAVMHVNERVCVSQPLQLYCFINLLSNNVYKTDIDPSYIGQNIA